MEIQERKKKINGKFQGVLKVLMEFQGVQFLKMEILNRGGGGRTIPGKAQ